MISLQSSFPNGKYWNHVVTNGYNDGDSLKARGDESFANSVTSTPCATHSGKAKIGQYDCNNFDGGLQCWGFAAKLFYETFGQRISQLQKRTDKNNISVGDYIRYGTDSNGHSAIVLSRSGDYITVVECNNLNYGGFDNIHWGGGSSVSSVSYFKHATNWVSINDTYASNPTAEFSDWYNDRYTFVSSTNASIGQEITASGGDISEVGMILYDNNGNRLGSAGGGYIQGISRYYFIINTELGVTLNPNTTYKYQFYAVVGGQTIYGPTKQFTTTGIIFNDWYNDNYTYMGTTDAGIGQEVIASGGNYTQVGMILYNSVGDELGRASDTPTPNIYKYYYKINEELHVTLTPGTTYRYRFFAVVNGVTYYSDIKSFTTNGEAAVDMKWENSFGMPSKTNAYVSAKAVSPSSGTFTSGSIRVWDNGNNLVASKTEAPFSKSGAVQTMIYDISAETGALLLPSSTYTYQFSVTFNGRVYESPVYSLTTEGENDRHFGIDVSSHQGYINWEEASKHIDFVIIRCGYGSDYIENDDANWEYNVSECERLNIPYGVYLYSYAENLDEAKSEAAHALRLLKNHHPDLPVYYDLEDSKTVGALSELQLYRQTEAFCGALEAAGYKAGIYSSLSWWNGKLSDSAFREYERWTAAYGDFYPQCAEWELWQYSSSGRIPGINESVDLNHSKESVAAFVPGDVNGDGKVDITDATMVQMFAAEVLVPTEVQIKAADVNLDGNVDISDATLIQMFAAEVIDHF